MLKKIKNKLFGNKMKHTTIPIDDYMEVLQQHVIRRMQYHNATDNPKNTVALAEEFFELFDPEDDSEILYSYRLKKV